MDHIKHWLDAGAAATAFASLIGWLPHIASALSILWLCIQIYDRFTRKKKERANEF
jgi:hypothetical protein